MKTWLSKGLRHALLLGGLGFSSDPLFAQGEWRKEGGKLGFEIKIADHLTPQQKKLIYSGFTTYSNLRVRLRYPDGHATLAFLSECTVSFDLWEEKFQLTGFLENRVSKSLRTFDEYADTCLKARIGNINNINELYNTTLEVRLEISQVSQDFANDVRQWLIQQQSGVMRGLFAHMLGELKLSESLELVIKPPRAGAT